MALSWRTLIMKKGRSANSHSPLAASPPPMTEGEEEQRKRQKQTRHEEPPMTEDEEEQRKRRRKTRRSPMTEDSDGQRKQRKQKTEKRHKEAHMKQDKAERVVPYGAKPDPRHATEDNDSDATTLIFGRSQPSPSWLAPPTSTGVAPEVFVVEPTHCKGCGTPLPPESAGSRCGPCHLALSEPYSRGRSRLAEWLREVGNTGAGREVPD